MAAVCGVCLRCLRGRDFEKEEREEEEEVSERTEQAMESSGGGGGGGGSTDQKQKSLSRRTARRAGAFVLRPALSERSSRDRVGANREERSSEKMASQTYRDSAALREKKELKSERGCRLSTSFFSPSSSSSAKLLSLFSFLSLPLQNSHSPAEEESSQLLPREMIEERDLGAFAVSFLEFRSSKRKKKRRREGRTSTKGHERRQSIARNAHRTCAAPCFVRHAFFELEIKQRDATRGEHLSAPLRLKTTLELIEKRETNFFSSSRTGHFFRTKNQKLNLFPSLSLVPPQKIKNRTSSPSASS